MAERLTRVTSWHGLIPVGFELVLLQEPGILVELGTHSGDSYCAFCQGVEMAGAATKCFAVDTWVGDEQAGLYGPEILEDLKQYHDPRYSRFSSLLQSTFENALRHFDDRSIDFLHIDGLHTYDAVKHDFLTWLPKLSNRAIVLFHDISVRDKDFGVRRFWEELKTEYRTIQFEFSHGLGVLAVGQLAERIKPLFELAGPDFFKLHDLAEALGRRIINEAAVRDYSQILASTRSQLQEQAETTHSEWTQRIHLEDVLSKTTLDLEDLRKRYEIESKTAESQTYLERNRRVQVEKELAAANVSFNAAKQEVRSEHAQRIQIESELAKTLSELAEASLRHSADLQTAATMKEELAQVKKHLTWAEQELTRLADAQRQAVFYRSELQRALNSKSWKLTKPLRALTSALRGREAVGSAPARSEAISAPEPDAKSDEGEGGVPFGRAAWDRYGQERLTEFLAKSDHLEFPSCEQPSLSVILVLFNKAHLTLLSLESILANAEVPYELILVDNGSTDSTGELLKRVRGVRTILNAQNEGFGPACMKAAQVAQGQYLCFFNNDALLQPKAFGLALENFLRSDRIGAVGGKILLADGTLQEAGSIVWSDGSALGYGRSSDPLDPAYQFRRPVDYCSGAFLFTPRSLFSELGGFREIFAPAYYEDTDYCLRVWQHGLQVIYEPEAVIRHYESASSGGNELAQRQMAEKQALFVEEWAKMLPQHLSPSMSNVLRARIATSSPELRILYLDDRIPHRELGSGFPRSNDVLQHLVAQGHHVTCVALSFPFSSADAEYRDISREVELVDGTKDLASVLNSYLPVSDLLWVSRPHNMQRYLASMADTVTPHRRPIIYDAEAIFSDRDRLKAQVAGHNVLADSLNEVADKEANLARSADVTLAVSERDARSLEAMGVLPVRVLGHCMRLEPTHPSFSERGGFLFLGAVHGDDNPNLDSLRYFCRQIWPAIVKRTGAEFSVAGFGTEKLEGEFGSIPGVRVLGPQPDTRLLYESARIFVVPTRYCAGIPYKAHEAAAYGVPMVVTPIIRTQLGWTSGKDCLAGEDAQQFADSCIKLFGDESLWNTIRDNALIRVNAELSREAFGGVIASILSEFQDLEARQGAFLKQPINV
jgi:GT2 family glycosyltransferase/glycosyltransferase involved in cell wall biosynthesis